MRSCYRQLALSACMVFLLATTSGSVAYAQIVSWGAAPPGGIPSLPSGVLWVDIAGSRNHSFGVRSDGLIEAWGPLTALITVPPLLPSLSYTKIFSGSLAEHALALRNDGWLAAWGSNSSGQCNVPPLPSGVTYVSAAAGASHSLALRSDGVAVAWGSNNQGQCDVPALPTGLTYVQVSAGGGDSLALRSDGSVVDWGNDIGTPPPLPPGTIYVEVAAGGSHALARRSDGVVVAWGYNNLGQCTVPVLPAGIEPVELAAGEIHSVSRLSDGSVVVWGNSAFGLHVVPNDPLLPFEKIASGGNHVLGLRTTACSAITYCTGKVNSIGCLPSIAASGTTSLAGPDDFHITASNLTSGQAGILIWSAGSLAAPFYGGTLCVATPIVRIFAGSSGGSVAGLDCTGTFSVSLTHAYMLGQGMQPGIPRYAQFWMRDVHDPIALGVGLSDGLQFVICP